MALFKILQGLDSKLNNSENPIKLTEGYCYYTVDNHLFYIDHKDKNGILTRSPLNSYDSIKFNGTTLDNNGSILNNNNLTVPTSSTIFNYLSNNYLPLTGGTLTGDLVGKNIITNTLQITEITHLNNSDKIVVLDNTGQLYYRTFNEIVGSIDLGKLKPNKVELIATSGQTVFTVPFDYDKLSSNLTVYYNGLLLKEGDNFTVNASNDTVQLVGFSAEAGDVITIMGILGAVAINFGQEAIDAINKMNAAINDGENRINLAISNAENYIQQLSSNLENRITTAVADAEARFTQLSTNLENRITTAVTDAETRFTNLQTQLENEINSYLLNAKNEFNQLKTNLENKVNDEIDKINYFLSQLPDDVSNLMIKNGNNIMGPNAKITMDSNYLPTGLKDVVTKDYADSMKISIIQNTSQTKSYVTTCVDPSTNTLLYHTNVYINHTKGILHGSSWNDYAEYRAVNNNEIQAGRCVVENGDDTLSISSKRLQPGANIISDTYGFIIGETDICKTPIAVSGRVLAYPYEDIEEFKNNIGHPVCSGPNGTVSIMTDEEYREYGYCAIGFISSVPIYKTWNNDTAINGRIWITIK